MTDLRNRIVGEGLVAAAELQANPKNWRLHPDTQREALGAVLGQVGWVQRVIVNQRTGLLVDGHLRVELAAAAGEEVPVTYVDLDEDEEALVLATLDPLAALAETDDERLAELLAGLDDMEPALQSLLDGLAEGADEPESDGGDPPPPRDLSIEPTPVRGSWAVHVGDANEVIPTLEGVFDAVLSDPPYGLSFMSRGWDHSVPGPDLWAKVLDKLRPGASVFAFGGTRTFHHLATAIEEAGFEVRDQLIWMYGEGFPKNHDVSKGIDKAAGVEREVLGTVEGGGRLSGDPDYESTDYGGGWHGVKITEPATEEAKRFDGYGTALKPAYEPICWGMKPVDESFANNATEHGVAGLHIRRGRVGDELRHNPSAGELMPDPEADEAQQLAEDEGRDTVGRWPANVILDEAAGEALDAQAGDRGGGYGVRGASSHIYGGGKGFTGATGDRVGYGDEGGPSRFFYCPKASAYERDAGLADFDPVSGSEITGRKKGSAGARASAYAGTTERERRNTHPTVKPVELIRYLAGLLLPPPRADGQPRRILVPFSGSGSEMIGCMLAGWDEVIGVELSEDFATIARARLDAWFTTDEEE